MSTAGPSTSTCSSFSKNVNREKINDLFKNWVPPTSSRTGRKLKTPDLLDANPTHLKLKCDINRDRRFQDTKNNNLKTSRQASNDKHDVIKNKSRQSTYVRRKNGFTSQHLKKTPAAVKKRRQRSFMSPNSKSKSRGGAESQSFRYRHFKGKQEALKTARDRMARTRLSFEETPEEPSTNHSDDFYVTSSHSGQAALSKQVVKFRDAFHRLNLGQQYQIAHKIISSMPKEILPLEEQHEYIKKTCVAINVLDSVKDNLEMYGDHKQRDSVVARNLLLQAVSGKQVRYANQLTEVSTYLNTRKNTLFDASKKRKEAELIGKLHPLRDLLQRASPTGNRVVSMEWKLRTTALYESDLVSDPVKGSYAVFKQLQVGPDGTKSVLLLNKRVIKLPDGDLLEVFQEQIDFPFSRTVLSSLRPPHVLPRSQHARQVCMCHYCFNPTLILRGINSAMGYMAKHGNADEKKIAKTFPLLTSSVLLENCTHRKGENKEWYDFKCFMQTCDKSSELCGPEKLDSFFQPLLSVSNLTVSFFLNEKQAYTKPDGSLGKKWAMSKKSMGIFDTVSLLKSFVYGKAHRTPMIEHKLACTLASTMRKDIDLAVSDTCIVRWTDFSKALQVLLSEEIKGLAFAGSNPVFNLLGQIIQAVALPPSAPRDLEIEDEGIFFSSPGYDGGTRISHYEVHVTSGGSWFMLKKITVLHLSPEPDLKQCNNIFEDIEGSLELRVVAFSRAGAGEPAFIKHEGEGDFDHTALEDVLDEHMQRKFATFLEEHFSYSDLNDLNKGWEWVRHDTLEVLKSFGARHKHNVTRMITVADNGGENGGTQGPANESYSEVDYGLESIKCQTSSEHSGQKSDAACSAEKASVNLDIKSNRVHEVYGEILKARDLVNYKNSQPMFRERRQAFYLRATVTHRAWRHHSTDSVFGEDREMLLERGVNTYSGISKVHQVFSTGQVNQVLGRERTCVCSFCLERDWENCVRLEYVDTPVLLNFSQPSFHLPGLRSNETGDNAETLVDMDANTSPFANLISPGNFFAIAGDNVEGFYLVEVFQKVDENSFEAIFYSRVGKSNKFKAEKTKNIIYVTSIMTTFEPDVLGSKKSKQISVSDTIINEIVSQLE